MGNFFLSQIVWCFVECIWQQSRLFFVLYVTMKFIILFLLITCSLCIFDRIQYYTDRFTTEVIPPSMELISVSWGGTCRLTRSVTCRFMQTYPLCDLPVHANLPSMWLTGTCRLARSVTYRYMQTYTVCDLPVHADLPVYEKLSSSAGSGEGFCGGIYHLLPTPLSIYHTKRWLLVQLSTTLKPNK